jgi:RNA polymerase sigma factor (sigma-70 family)
MPQPVVTRVDPHVLAERVVQPSPDFGAPSENELAREELASRLLGFATPEQQDALRLRFAGLPYSEVAEMLNISIRSVRGREARGMEKIRAAIEANPDAYLLP